MFVEIKKPRADYAIMKSIDEECSAVLNQIRDGGRRIALVKADTDNA